MRFWLGTCAVEPPIAGTGATHEPIVARGASRLAIEVIKDGDAYAVLFSETDDLDHPQSLACRIGFANQAKTCSIWRDRGFPLVDAIIEHEGDALRVLTPYFADQEAMTYGELLISIAGIRFDDKMSAPDELPIRYEQFQESPDSAWPATYIRRRPVSWRLQRTNVARMKLSHELRLEVERARCPSLRPLTNGPLQVVNAWSGELKVDIKPEYPYRRQTQRVDRQSTFGVPAFRFEGIEAIGFRIDLGKGAELDDRLGELIKPLNFHLDTARRDDRIPDFRYRAATRTVLIELLRYDKMKLKTQDSPLTVLDYQSQHELVVRVLVGRVDDDTAQAHAPAVYVPAIFVDNPWSKIVGRDLQGFDKRLADFCVETEFKEKSQKSPKRMLSRWNHTPLRPDGCLPSKNERRPLADISRIKLVEWTAKAEKSAGPTILDIDCLPSRYRNWDHLQKVDLGLALADFSLTGTRWRQTDFDQPEFRRSFARDVVGDVLKGFHSVQVTPVGQRELDKAWITGTFTVDDDVSMVSPVGGVRLTFHSERTAPRGWIELCTLLGIPEGERGTLAFQTGSWYRLKFSMSMTINDGLEWTDARP